MDRPFVTLKDLRTEYSLEDLYDLIEVYMVNSHNEHVANKALEKK